MLSNYNFDLKRKSLSQNEVHMWLISVSDAAKKLSYWESTLSSGELKRASAFKFIKDKNLFIASRGILRCLLSSYLGKSPPEINIIYGHCGKPYLFDEENIYFNISHSKDYALYAFSCTCEVGVDIEYIQKDFNTKEISKNIFDLQEQVRLESMSAEERVNAFFKMWVCQEAFLKYTGRGWLNNGVPPFRYEEIREDGLMTSSSEENVTFPYYWEKIPGYASALFMEVPSKVRHYLLENIF